MIAVGHGIPLHNNKILNPQGLGRQHISLYGHPVTVPAIDMNNRLKSLPADDGAAAKRAHPHDTPVHIRDHHGIDAGFQVSYMGHKF